MESIDVGFLSVLPPLIAIVLALLTKEVISSLIIGILSGTVIYAFADGGSFIANIAETIKVTFVLMGDRLGANASIILFLSMLGALVAIITMAGGSGAYGDWARRKIKTRSGSQIATFFLGILIFVDDYFNCLTIGTVMRPVTDQYKVSHAKLAYIIDATAAPICIIAPISSWAASVISYLADTGIDGMSAFVMSIPFNLYAMLTIIAVFAVCKFNINFGQMAVHENLAMNEGKLSPEKHEEDADEDDLARIKPSKKGKVIDLVLPIISLIIASVVSMLYVGGYFEGGMTLQEGFGNTDAGLAITLGGFIALIITFFLMVPRKVISFKGFMSGIGIGIKSMVPAFVILTLAWTISGVCRQLLNTGEYVGHLVEVSNMPIALIPAIIFLVAGLLSFSMGTSWGTFGILIPIVAVVCESVAPDLMIIALAATLAGSVFGDHCSPISDTTILSATGANCSLIDHVTTQMPYAVMVGLCSFVGYIVAGFTESLALTLGTSILLLVIALVVLHRRGKVKNA